MASAQLEDNRVWEGENGTRQLFKDAEELYRQTQDLEIARECITLHNAMADVYSKAEANATDLIKTCASRVDELKKKAQEMAALPASTPQIEALKKEIAASLAVIEEHTTSEADGKVAVDELEQQLKKMKLEHDSAAKASVVQVPLMKHSLSLYANITKIKWDFSSDNIAGSMINTDTGKIKTFEFSEEEHSKFDIANKIWDTIDA